MASNSENNSRQNIRKEIAKTSKDEYILKEMKRLGFWPATEEKPRLAEQLIKRRGELGREISELAKKVRSYEDKEALLRKHRKERMRKSREKQKENKEKREAERLERKRIWQEKQSKDIIYLGDKYSAGLKNKTNDLDRLSKNQLPSVKSVLELANQLNTTISELRYLSFYRPVTKVSHYIRYAVPKKAGGERKISAPMPRLKKVQRAILDELLTKVPISEYANGFAPGRSIVSNARPHVKADLVVNMDLKDFFPSVDYKRVWGMFKKLGFSDQSATVLGLICTEPIEEKVAVDGVIYYVSEGERVLPQGAPTSPAITNIICRRLDQRMAGISKKLGFTYTRYADDMTFSGPESSRKNLQKLLWQTKGVIKDEDFQIHPEKTRVMTKGNRQEVTGIIVNEKPSISRKKLKAFRALLFQIEKDGPKGKTWGESPDLMASILGFARYVYMVDPVKGKPLLEKVSQLRQLHVPKKPKPKAGEDGDKPWWKFW